MLQLFLVPWLGANIFYNFNFRIFDLVVNPIVKAGILPDGFVNSAVINDYQVSML
jgi:hypothetical protein